MDFYEDGNLIETCIPYDESIKTVEDARRARALADGKGRSSAVARTTTTPAAAPSNLSADGLLSRYNSTFILDFVSENPAIFRADYGTYARGSHKNDTLCFGYGITDRI